MLGTPSRIRVLVSGLILISVVSGTCFMQTSMFMGGSSFFPGCVYTSLAARGRALRGPRAELFSYFSIWPEMTICWTWEEPS